MPQLLKPFVILILILLMCVPVISSATPHSSLTQYQRSSISFPSFWSEKNPKSFPTSQRVVSIEIPKPVTKNYLPMTLGLTSLPLGISLDKLHKNIDSGIKRLSEEPEACWIPISPIGPIRIPMSVVFIDGYYCDKPWIPHVDFAG